MLAGEQPLPDQRDEPARVGVLHAVAMAAQQRVFDELGRAQHVKLEQTDLRVPDGAKAARSVREKCQRIAPELGQGAQQRHPRGARRTEVRAHAVGQPQVASRGCAAASRSARAEASVIAPTATSASG